MPAFTSAITGLNNGISSITAVNNRLNNWSDRMGIGGQPLLTGEVSNKKAIIWQIQGLPERLSVPDLTMKINPRNLDSSYSQLINRKRTLGGFIEEHWGEQLDSLSASGTTGEFFGEFGLTNAMRRDTEMFRKFEEFVTIYRNNGSVYDSRSGQIAAQGFVIMNYDSGIYHGFFESFTINESSQKPYCLDYDFSFKVTSEVYPGRMQSFQDVTTVPRPGAPINDTVTMDITTTSETVGAT
jgi:hypothetical protein